MNKAKLLAAGLAVLLLASSCRCSKDSNQDNGTTAIKSPEEILLARGRLVYQSNCTACHNPNPKMSGSLGPDVWGSSKELLEARIVHGNYPEGYKPKRSSAAMQPLPHLAKDVDALHAFLNTN